MSYLGEIPTNARLFSEYLRGDESPIDEKDFKSEELAEMLAMVKRQDKVNLEKEEQAKYELESRTKESLVDWVDNPRSQDLMLNEQTNELAPKYTEDQWREIAQGKLDTAKQKLESFEKSRNKTSVHYSDEAYSRPEEKMGWLNTIVESFTSPARNIETSLGQFNAFKNDDGTVTVKDNYNYGNQMFDTNTVTVSLKDFLKDLPLALTSPESFGTLLSRYAIPKRNREVSIELGPYDQIENGI